MKNLGQMMRQAQEMQTKMAELQEQLAATEVTGVSGGGMVRVITNGKGEMRSVNIDPALVDTDEIGVLEDLIVAAVNDARSKAEAASAERMRELTGGLALPPDFKLPF